MAKEKKDNKRNNVNCGCSEAEALIVHHYKKGVGFMSRRHTVKA